MSQVAKKAASAREKLRVPASADLQLGRVIELLKDFAKVCGLLEQYAQEAKSVHAFRTNASVHLALSFGPNFEAIVSEEMKRSSERGEAEWRFLCQRVPQRKVVDTLRDLGFSADAEGLEDAFELAWSSTQPVLEAEAENETPDAVAESSSATSKQGLNLEKDTLAAIAADWSFARRQAEGLALSLESQARSDETVAHNEKRQYQKGINERMLAKLQSQPECQNWTIRKWREFLGCAIASIQTTATWNCIIKLRSSDKLERQDRDSKRGTYEHKSRKPS